MTKLSEVIDAKFDVALGLWSQGNTSIRVGTGSRQGTQFEIIGLDNYGKFEDVFFRCILTRCCQDSVPEYIPEESEGNYIDFSVTNTLLKFNIMPGDHRPFEDMPFNEMNEEMLLIDTQDNLVFNAVRQYRGFYSQFAVESMAVALEKLSVVHNIPDFYERKI